MRSCSLQDRLGHIDAAGDHIGRNEHLVAGWIEDCRTKLAMRCDYIHMAVSQDIGIPKAMVG